MPHTDPGRAPRLSVLIPVYNAADLLVEALDSVLPQVGDDTEVLVVDDGSTDGSGDVARRYGPQVRCITQTNGGLAAARNRGHLEARGRFHAWFDHDDICEPGRFALQLEVLERYPEIGLVSSDFSAFSDAGTIADSFATRYYAKMASPGLAALYHAAEDFRGAVLPDTDIRIYHGSVYPSLAFGNFVHPPTVMMRAEVWERAGPLRPGLASATDWEFLVRASRHVPFAYIARSLLRYRRHESQLTSDTNRPAGVPGEMRAFGQILDADPALRDASDEVRKLYRHWHLTLAETAIATQRVQAFRHLAQSLTYGFDSRRFLLAALRASTPPQLLPAFGRARRWMRGRTRPSTT